MQTYTAWKQYEFSVEAESLEGAYEKLRELDTTDALEVEYWVDDKDEV